MPEWDDLSDYDEDLLDDPSRVRPIVKRIWVDHARVSATLPGICVEIDSGEPHAKNIWVKSCLIDGRVEMTTDEDQTPRVWMETADTVTVVDINGKTRIYL